MKKTFFKSLLTIACLLCGIGVYAHDFEVGCIYNNKAKLEKHEFTKRTKPTKINRHNKTTQTFTIDDIVGEYSAFAYSGFKDYPDEEWDVLITKDTKEENKVWIQPVCLINGAPADIVAPIYATFDAAKGALIMPLGQVVYEETGKLKLVTGASFDGKTIETTGYIELEISRNSRGVIISFTDQYYFGVGDILNNGWWYQVLFRISFSEGVDVPRLKFEENGICYKTIDHNSVAVTYMGNSSDDYQNEYTGDIVIPEMVTFNETNYTVTSIGEYAFCDCTGLTSITIPNSVTNIGYCAFDGCSSMTSITLSDSIVSIDDYAFFNCVHLTSISLGENIVSIGEYAFANCSSLTEITIPGNVASIGYAAFYFCENLKSVILNDGVVSIGDYAFVECSSLSEVTIPNSVTNVGKGAFYETPFFNNQPDGVIYFGGVLYQYKGTMPNNTHIDIKENIVTISERAFYNCSGLTSVTLSESIVSIGDYAFADCIGLTEIIIPNSTTILKEAAFAGCSGLTTITLGEGLTTIESMVFYNCAALKSVVLGNNVTTIGDAAFIYCSSLTDFTIGKNVESIGGYTFEGCSYLASIFSNALIPPTIKSNTFTHYRASLYVPQESIEAYKEAEYWKEFNILNNNTKIYIDGIYYQITSSTEVKVVSPNNYGEYSGDVVIPETITINDKTYRVTSIDEYAFSQNGLLTSITIPKSIKSIGEDAFNTAYNLKYIYCYAIEPPTIESGTFSNEYVYLYVPIESMDAYKNAPHWDRLQFINKYFVDGICYGVISTTEADVSGCLEEDYNYSGHIIIPETVVIEGLTLNVTSIGEEAFWSSENITEVTIPNSVVSIDNYAFSSCEGLITITLGEKVNNIGEEAFIDCKRIKNIYVYNEVPPTICNNTFEVYVNDAATLYVPAGCKNVYSEAKYWKYFVNIQEMGIAESITLDKTEVKLKVNETVTLTATILPETTINKEVVWSSSDSDVASVENGEVTAHKVGTATITATTTDGSNLSASCIINVEELDAVGKILADAEDGKYYDLSGRRVVEPTNGIYIVKQGNTVRKVFINK